MNWLNIEGILQGVHRNYLKHWERSVSGQRSGEEEQQVWMKRDDQDFNFNHEMLEEKKRRDSSIGIA
jgi:hypothetical protein